MSSNPYVTDYQIGQDNVQRLGLDVHKPVFTISALLIVGFILFTLLMPESAESALGGAKAWSITHGDWLFMLSSNFFILFCLLLVLHPVSRLRLGGRDAKPEFSRMAWFAMLFAAGMGTGLMFWGVAEPVAYYTDWSGTPLNAPPRTPEGATAALSATVFHYGLHPWAMYAVIGLSLAFFAYNKGLPLTLRSVFYPLLGERVWGWSGHIIDIVAVLATLFGLATSLGLGAAQAASGLDHLFGIGDGLVSQVGVIVAVTLAAIYSVSRGLDGGVKRLSNLNMMLAALLVVFLFIVGPTMDIITGLGTTSVGYLEYLLPLSNWIDRPDEGWFHSWTIFYWAWWISWSPFVGMFIARISRGRSVREFVTAVLVVPTLVTIVWMTVFGGTALEEARAAGSELAQGIDTPSMAMFQMFDSLPLSSITSCVAIVLVLVFFVTSSDSGSLVIDSITAGGKQDAPTRQRIFWAAAGGLIACALLYGGGSTALSALQAGAISTGLPFAVVLLVMCFSLFRGLRWEKREYDRANAST